MPSARRSRRSRKRRENLLVKTIWASLAILCLCLFVNGGRPKKIQKTAPERSEQPPSNVTIPVKCTDKTPMLKAQLKNMTSAYNVLVLKTQQSGRELETLETGRQMSKIIIVGLSLLVLIFATLCAWSARALICLKQENQEIALRLDEALSREKGILSLVQLNGSYTSVVARGEALQREKEELARKAARLKAIKEENRQKLETLDTLKGQLEEQVQYVEDKRKEVDRLEESKKILKFEVRHFTVLAQENIDLERQLAKLEGAQRENSRLKAQSDQLWAIQKENWARAAELQMRDEKVERGRTAARERVEELKRVESKLAQEVNAVKEAKKRLEGLKSIAANVPALLEEEKRVKEQVVAAQQLSTKNKETARKLQDSVEHMAEESRRLDELQKGVDAQSQQLELKRSEYEAARMSLENKTAHLGSLDELQVKTDQLQQQAQESDETEIDYLIDELVDDLQDDLPENEAVTTVALESVEGAEMALDGDDADDEPEDSVHDTMVTAKEPAEPFLEEEQLTRDGVENALPLPIEESQLASCEPEEVMLEVDDPQEEPEDCMGDTVDDEKLPGDTYLRKEGLAGDPIEKALAQPTDKSQFQHSKAEVNLEVDSPQEEPYDPMGDIMDTGNDPANSKVHDAGLTDELNAKELAQPIAGSQLKSCNLDTATEKDTPQEELEECTGNATDLPEQEGSEGLIQAKQTEIPYDQSQGNGEQMDQKIEKTTSSGKSPLSQINMVQELELENDAEPLRSVSDCLDARSVATKQEDKENKPSAGKLPDVVVEQQSAKYIVDAHLIQDLCSSMKNFKISEPQELNKSPANYQIEQPRDAEKGDGEPPISLSQLKRLVFTMHQQHMQNTARLRRVTNRIVGEKQGGPSYMANTKPVPEGAVLNCNSKAPDMGSNAGGKSRKEPSEESIKTKQAEIVRLMEDIRRRQQNNGQRMQRVAQKMQLKKRGG